MLHHSNTPLKHGFNAKRGVHAWVQTHLIAEDTLPSSGQMAGGGVYQQSPSLQIAFHANEILVARRATHREHQTQQARQARKKNPLT